MYSVAARKLTFRINRARKNSTKEYYPADFESLVKELIVTWYDIGTPKDTKKAMKRLTWRLHSDYKKRLKRTGASIDDDDQPSQKTLRSQVNLEHNLGI